MSAESDETLNKGAASPRNSPFSGGNADASGLELGVKRRFPNNVSWFEAQWPAPARVRTLITTRTGGVSHAPYDAMNLGDHVGDAPEHVRANRRLLRERLPAEPLWLRQVHGTTVVDAAVASPGSEADGAVAFSPGEVLAIMTADCLPVLLADSEAKAVGIAHAGWRGLADGVIESTVSRLGVPADRLVAFLGPAIGAARYEVGPEVREVFVSRDPAATAAFAPGRPGKYSADLYLLARQRLAKTGIMAVFGGGYCTYSEVDRFFSYRRDGPTGRMASLIWIE